MSNVVDFPDPAREADRFKAIHYDHAPLSAFAAQLGTPDEWLGSALAHLKERIGPGDCAGSTEVSKAAISLVIWKLEEVAFGGVPWSN